MNNIEILEKLVSFNTIEDKENLEIMDYVGNYLKELGFNVEYIFNKEKTKKCLIAKTGQPNLLFIGHTDTVNYCDWTYDPFKLTQDGNKLHGLGTCDMKGGIAAFLSALKDVDLNQLKKGIQIVLTFDEEISFEGIKLIEHLQSDWPNNVIVGEPTSLIPVINTKGCMDYKILFKGKAAHSSNLTKGENAVLKCVDFIAELRNFTEELKKEENNMFEIAYTTSNIGIINGGKATNIVPDSCELSFDFRTIKKSQHEYINNKVEELAKKYQATVIKLYDMFPLENNTDISFYENITGNKKKAFNYITEASLIKKNNVVILGVGPNNEHAKDEYVDKDSYNKTIKTYIEIINYYCK